MKGRNLMIYPNLIMMAYIWCYSLSHYFLRFNLVINILSRVGFTPLESLGYCVCGPAKICSPANTLPELEDWLVNSVRYL